VDCAAPLPDCRTTADTVNETCFCDFLSVDFMDFQDFMDFPWDFLDFHWTSRTSAGLKI
jgi:hypothetical protein